MTAKKTVQSLSSRRAPKTKKISRTITKDLTISLVLMVVVLSLLAIGFNYFYDSYREEQRLEKLADEYRSYLIDSLELPIWTLNRKIVEKITESYFNNQLVEMIQVSEINFDSSGIPEDRIIFNKSKFTESDLIFRKFEIRHNNATIGHVKFGLTRRFYKNEIHRLLLSHLITLLFIIPALVFLCAVLIRFLVKQPLNSLNRAINQISAGNYRYAFTEPTRKEIFSIISAFSVMGDQIQKREDSLADINRQMEFEIKARKKIESAIRNREAQLRATFEATSDGILVFDNKGHIINANDRFYQMWNMPEKFRENNHSKAVTDFIIHQLKNSNLFNSNFLRINKESFEELYLADGRIFEWVCCPLFYSGKNFGSVMNFRDVTDLKKSIQALRESEDRFRQLSEVALEAIAIYANGIIIQVNNQFLKMFGYSRKDVIGKLAFDEIIAPESKELFNPEEISKQTTFLEIMGLRDDGKTFPLIVQTRQMVFYGKNIFVSVIRDVSDRKAAEAETEKLKEKLARSEKMEALGLLAGGVAHDLNNILSGIVSYPELLLMKKGLDPKTRKALKVIQESGERAAAVVHDLTTISRGIASNREVLSLNSVVKEYLISPEFQKLKLRDSGIELTTDLIPDLLHIDASRLHIRKSIMNLVTNAAEAIETNGQIRISTTNCFLDRPLKAHADVNVGEYAVLSISDSGSGITEEEMGRIFEPFYTKKVMGRSGTGLGLTVVWNTVQDHHGYVVVTNNQMGGTCFDMYFPITRESIKEQVKKISIDTYLGNSQLILVVDDEKTQRDIACEMLKALGYRPLGVKSGEAAVEQIRKKSFDLILLDMIMPTGMNGRETYKEILKYSPGQKAIIASGFSVNEDVKAAQELGAGQFLKKPYTIEELGLAIRNGLAGNKK